MRVFSIEELQVFPTEFWKKLADKGIPVSKIQRLASQRRQIGVQEAGALCSLVK
jgi:hypothetical protein